MGSGVFFYFNILENGSFEMGLESVSALDIFIQMPQPDFHLQRPTAAVLVLSSAATLTLTR